MIPTINALKTCLCLLMSTLLILRKVFATVYGYPHFSDLSLPYGGANIWPYRHHHWCYSGKRYRKKHFLCGNADTAVLYFLIASFKRKWEEYNRVMPNRLCPPFL